MSRTLKDYPWVAIKRLDGQIDFVRLFGRSGPVHVEVGSGKGTFLLNEAMAHPEANFLGIERANKYYRHAVDRIGRWGLTNVRIIRIDAPVLLANFLRANSVDCYHVYFPDPWPKRRHCKRRLFCPANLEVLLRTLKTDGSIRTATDCSEYFELITELVEAQRDRLERIEFLPTAGAQPGECVGTNYERKYLKDTRPIYTIAARKI
jgi:tRNA (guanine-N7-)-methyltransferase